jgi:hypothetical protein
MKTLTPSQEWTAFNRLHEKGASRKERLAFARGMRDAKNRKAALRHLRHLLPPTAKQRRESAERQRAINSVTEAEIRRHCQFAGLPRL